MTEGRTSNHHEALVTATHALHLLTLFSDEHPELGVTEMSERLGLAKSSVSRIVSTYVTEGVLVQDEITRRYRLGPLLLELGLIAGELHPVRQAAEAPLQELRDATGQNTLLWLRDGDEEALCLASHRGAKAIAPPIPAGTRIQLADTIAGRAMEAGRGAVVRGPVLAEAEPTVGGVGGVGGVRSVHGRLYGGHGAASAIVDRTGEPVAAITVIAPEAWFRSQPPDRVEAVIARVAQEVSARLG